MPTFACSSSARWTASPIGIARRGLFHPNPRVREACCVVLDHRLERDCIPDLIANLNHDDDGVRGWAIHALACDRCKQGSCRPAENDTLPIAIKMMIEDPSPTVRS